MSLIAGCQWHTPEVPTSERGAWLGLPTAGSSTRGPRRRSIREERSRRPPAAPRVSGEGLRSRIAAALER